MTMTSRMFRPFVLLSFSLALSLIALLAPGYAQDDAAPQALIPDNISRLSNVDAVQLLRSNRLVFSPDGDVIAALGRYGVTLIAAEDLSVLGLLQTGDYTHSIAFSGGGERLITASEAYQVCLWHVESQLQIRCLDGESQILHAVAWSPNSPFITVADRDEQVLLYDNLSFAPVSLLGSTTSWIYQLAYAPDNNSLAAATGEGALYLWRFDRAEVQQILAHDNDMIALDWSPDSRQIASIGLDRRLSLIDVENATVQHLATIETSLGDVAWSADGRMVATVAADGVLRIYEASSGALLEAITVGDQILSGLAWSPDGRSLLTLDVVGSLRRWQVPG